MKKLTKAEQKTLESLIDRAQFNGQSIPLLLDGVAESSQNPTTVIDAVSATLAERGTRYGDFTNHAQIAQDLQDVLRGKLTTETSSTHTVYDNLHARAGWSHLSLVQRQALTVICDKLARIISGDPNYADNWHDIQGYAKLVEDRLPKES
jgi:hypothetical protein